MKQERILFVDHDPDPTIISRVSHEKHADFAVASGYLQAVGKAVRFRPGTIYVRRDLPWLTQGSSTLAFTDSPSFAGVRVVFYTPDELRGEWPSHKMHRPLFE